MSDRVRGGGGQLMSRLPGVGGPSSPQGEGARHSGRGGGRRGLAPHSPDIPQLEQEGSCTPTGIDEAPPREGFAWNFSGISQILVFFKIEAA